MRSKSLTSGAPYLTGDSAAARARAGTGAGGAGSGARRQSLISRTMQEKKDHLFAKQAGDYSLWYDVIPFHLL